MVLYLQVKIYQDRSDKDTFVTVVCILSLTSLLATVCLFPVDIALVSSTTSNHTGLKKHWATPEAIHNILLSLKIVYYLLYSLDAALCLLLIPFAYFWYEEWDQDTTTSQRLKGALKYSTFFVALVIILFITGFFVPVAEHSGHWDLDYFKKLLMENHGERALTFIVGLLMCFGTVLVVFYTAPGLALAPVALIKSMPTTSLTAVSVETGEALAVNRERQRAIEVKAAGAIDTRPSSRDRRELELLKREERHLMRRQNNAEEQLSSRTKSAYRKLQAIGRPFKIIFGIILLLIAVLLFVSTIITSIDKVLNSPCGKHCGYILPSPTILNPLNSILVAAAKAFPVDYVLTLALVLLFFLASIIGIGFIGIRFLWIQLFSLRLGRTKPQGLLMATILLTLITLALNYTLTTTLLPAYAHYGGQRFQDPVDHSRTLPCDERGPQEICTPSVASTFVNRVTLNFPFFGWVMWVGQMVWAGVWLVCTVTAVAWTPRFEGDEEAEEEEEEESLLAGTARRTGAAWEDLTGRGRTGGAGNGQAGSAGNGQARGYGTVGETEA